MYEAPHSLFAYDANEILAIVSTALYGVCTLLSFYRAHKDKCYRYLWPWLTGLVMEVAGYAIRIYSAYKPRIIWAYAVQQVLIVLAPALLAATLYMAFGRLVWYVDAGRVSPISARKVTKLFVTMDVISFSIQGGGSGLYSNPDLSDKKGLVLAAKAIILVGLGMQIVAFSIFLVFSIIYKRRTEKANLMYSGGRKLLLMLWVVGILILIRSVFRMIEFGEGDESGEETSGYILTHEWTFYVFECLVMLIAIAIFAVWPPSLWLPLDRNDSLHGIEAPPPVKNKGQRKAWWKRMKQDEEDDDYSSSNVDHVPLTEQTRHRDGQV